MSSKVHYIGERWNLIHSWVFEASEAIIGLTEKEKVLIL